MRGFTNPRGVLLTVCLAALFVFSFSSPIAVYASGTVTDCSTFGPGAGTLQDALVGGGTITFGCSGTILVPEMTISSDTTIDANGNDVTLDANGSNRHFTVNAGAALTLRGLKLIKGNFGSGGSIYSVGTLVIENTEFNSNHANVGTGSAIYSEGQLTISGSQFIGNMGGGPVSIGAAVFNAGNATISSSTFTGNLGGMRTSAGAIYNASSGTLVGTDLTIANNTSAVGAVFNAGQMTLIRATVTDNHSADDASVIPGASGIGNSGVLTLQDSTVIAGTVPPDVSDVVQNVGTMTVNNTSFNSGEVLNGYIGGARDFVPKSGQMQLTNVTINNGLLWNIYGGMTVERSALISSPGDAFNSSAFVSLSSMGAEDQSLVGDTTFVNVTIVNAAGAAIRNGFSGMGTADGNTTLTNVTLFGNGSGIVNVQGIVTANNTLAANNSGGNCSGAVTNLNSLSDDGSCSGFTQVTTAALALGALTNGTIPLNAGSVAIDAGNMGVCPSTDQRGVARPQGAGCDVGAYEFEGGVAPPVDGTVHCPANSTQIDIATTAPVITMLENRTLDFELNIPSDSSNGLLLVQSMVGHPEAGCPDTWSYLCEDQDNESFNVLVDGVQFAFVPDHGNNQWQEFSFPLPLTAGTHTIRFSHSLQPGNNPYGSVYINAAYCIPLDNGGLVVEPETNSSGGNAGQPQSVAPPAPTMPLCASLNGSTNSVVRTNMPAGTFGVHCNVLAQNGTGSMAAIGVQAVIDMGVIHAVDVFAPSSGAITSAEVCLQGQGDLVFLNAETSPRTVQPVAAVYRDGYTCGVINGEGTLVLVRQSGMAQPAAVQSAPAVRALSDCRVTTLNMLNLRSEPNANSAVITLVPYNLTLTATEFSPGWYRVIFEDGQGWLSADYVTTTGSCG